MSRLEEVEARLLHTGQSDWSSADEAAEYRHLSLSLAAEVDARDEVITKLLALVKPIIQPSKTYPTSHGYESDCRKHVTLSTIYALACKIAGRAE